MFLSLFIILSVNVPANTLITVYYEVPGKDMGNLQPKDNVNLAITPKRLSDDEGIDDDDESNQRNGRRKKQRRSKLNRRKVQQLTMNKGTVTYETSSVDSRIELCVRSRSANKSNPLRIGLRVVIGHDIEYYRTQAKNNHLSDMQANLMKLRDEIEDMIRSTDSMKKTEESFHDHNMSVHQASLWWPLIQTCVLLITGVTTIMHMTSFFSKHVL